MLSRYRLTFAVLYLLTFIILAGCSAPDPQLQQLSREIYNQKEWTDPLPSKTFSSDGCSWWPDYEWTECCVIHDTAYWIGGTRENRKEADIAIRQCVSTTGHPIIGAVMYHGIRMGGVYWLPTSFRWGFGWDFPQSGPPGTEY